MIDTDPTRRHTAAYVQVLSRCATFLGRDLADLWAWHFETLLLESDARSVSRGLEEGLLTVNGNYLSTRDPHQGTAWLVEGQPARPCWEYLPHAAAYVELILDLDYAVGSVRFETPDSELNLDLAVVDQAGQVLVLGEAKRDPRQVVELARRLPKYVVDPGKPSTARSGGPQGAERDAWKLAHQLWLTQAPWLWLVASGVRIAYRVDYLDGLTLTSSASLPSIAAMPSDLGVDWPRLRF